MAVLLWRLACCGSCPWLTSRLDLLPLPCLALTAQPNPTKPVVKLSGEGESALTTETPQAENEPGHSPKILADARVEAALTEAGLTGMADRDPATLSGGQQARVAVMRTLVADPCALLLDEPFSKLDADLKLRFRAFVFEHAREQGVPVLLVTHDPADAAAAGGPLIELGNANLDANSYN